MSNPDLYLTYNSSNVDLIQNSIESIRGTKYYFDLFNNNNISFSHLIELAIDSCNNEIVTYTLEVNHDIIYKKEISEWSSAIMSSDINTLNGRTKNIIDTLNKFHADGTITQPNNCIYIKYNSLVYKCEESLVLFGRRYYVLHHVTSSNNLLLPPTVTVA